MQIVAQKMLIGGNWVDRSRKIEVRNPENDQLLATVPAATVEDVQTTIESAKEGAVVSAQLSVHERIAILQRTAEIILQKKDYFAETIALEGSKTIREAKSEVRRCVETIRISAEEARRIHGETIPFSQMPGHETRVGYYYRFPIGIVAAITPFNDPLNLVAHKVGPAIASGNSIIVKPSTLTPLSAFLLAEAFEEAGLPTKILSVITGHGREIGDAIITNKAVRLISFTGGYSTGEEITKKAGVKKLAMELGSNSPTIILKDADLSKAIPSTVDGAFTAAGQNCIGVQRIYIEEEIYNSFVEQYVKEAKQYKMGEKLNETTDMGPLITEKEAKRVEEWVNDAVDAGAKLLTGGRRNGAFYEPTVLAEVPGGCQIAKEEIFGPVVLLYKVSDLNEAIDRANNVSYGLQAGIFTRNLEHAFSAIHRIEAGGVIVNDSSDFRVDAMPFGGVKQSGIGREGVKFAIEEMTEQKVVCFKLSNE